MTETVVTPAPLGGAFGVAIAGAALIVAGLTIGSEYAAAKAPASRISAASDSVSRLAASVVQRSPRTCFKLDKNTGELIPCQSSGAGGRAHSDPSATNSRYTGPLAFNYFNSDYAESLFADDPDSVVPNAYLLSQLAGISYEGQTVVDEFAEDTGLEALDVIHQSFQEGFDFAGPEGESTAYILFNDYSVFVAFQGSTGGPGGIDWMENNIDFWPKYKRSWGFKSKTVGLCPFCTQVEYDVVTIHHGFYDAMDLIYPDVLAAIEPLLEEGRHLWITGHSLGGAIAKLTAFRLQHEEDIRVQGVHVFGAPAVGDDNWFAAFNNEKILNVHRWNYEDDPMPTVTRPPMFYHVGIINNLHVDGHYELDADQSEMFWFPTACTPMYNANIAHMSYWQIMHDLLTDTHPHLLDEFPEPLAVPQGDCGDWFAGDS